MLLIDTFDFMHYATNAMVLMCSGKFFLTLNVLGMVDIIKYRQIDILLVVVGEIRIHVQSMKYEVCHRVRVAYAISAIFYLLTTLWLMANIHITYLYLLPVSQITVSKAQLQ